MEVEEPQIYTTGKRCAYHVPDPALILSDYSFWLLRLSTSLKSSLETGNELKGRGQEFLGFLLDDLKLYKIRDPTSTDESRTSRVESFLHHKVFDESILIKFDELSGLLEGINKGTKKDMRSAIDILDNHISPYVGRQVDIHIGGTL